MMRTRTRCSSGRREFERGELCEPSMALIPVTVAGPQNESREIEEVARPAAGAIHIELPGRALISVVTIAVEPRLQIFD